MQTCFIDLRIAIDRFADSFAKFRDDDLFGFIYDIKAARKGDPGADAKDEEGRKRKFLGLY
jgi:hypothetical protein